MEGEFWMPYMDFIKTFTHLEVVHLDSETSRDEPSMADKKRWSMRFYSGAWQRGVTAGGCRNNSGDNSTSSYHTSTLIYHGESLNTYSIRID